MAQAYTLTKKVTLSVSCTGTQEIVYVPNPSSSQSNYQYYYNFPYANFDTKYIDCFEIPNNATITSVTLQISGNTGSGSKSTALYDEGAQAIGTITSDNVKDYLSAGGRRFGFQIGFQPSRKGPYNTTQGSTMSASNTVVYTINITYEVANATTINYGTKEGWVPCLVHYCEEGTYKPCRAFYGANNEWIELD